ncbi:MAG: 4Fe-4S dicluster domain-containing protein [Candidatus Omnitrophota bacterium]|nr:MAG: 4Fe-4S dicluster domain-containing protein [Candidatus Omnitrophota bacterium]
MEDSKGLWKIKYESDLFPEFGREIAASPGGENIFSCIQCGTCSGFCPLSLYMDYTPRRIIAMTRAGFKEEVLSSSMIWMCASCYGCTVECPKEIKITDVMYALKQRAIKEGVYPRRFLVPILAHSFFKSVWKHGRNTESHLIVSMYMKSNPFKMLTQSLLGMKLWLKGRMGIMTDSIRDKKSLQSLLQAVKKIQNGKAH